MISANNITLRVGKKALFEDVNIKFREGNCYGLIGAYGEISLSLLASVFLSCSRTTSNMTLIRFSTPSSWEMPDCTRS